MSAPVPTWKATTTIGDDELNSLVMNAARGGEGEEGVNAQIAEARAKVEEMIAQLQEKYAQAQEDMKAKIQEQIETAQKTLDDLKAQAKTALGLTEEENLNVETVVNKLKERVQAALN